MRKHFFRPFIADPVCASSDPGHHVDVGRYFMAVVKSSVTIPVRAEVRDGFVGLDWGRAPPNFGTTAPTMWPLRSQGNNGVAEWAPEWQSATRAGSLARRRTHRVHARLSRRADRMRH